MKIRFVLTILMITFFFFFAEDAKGLGQPAPSAPPSSLPMGSAEAFRSWIVTNQIVSFNNAIYFTNTLGQPESYGNFGAKLFTSYLAYQQFVGSNSFKLFSDHRFAMDPTNSVRFVATVAYYIPELAQDGWAGWVQALYLNTNVGTVSSITSNSFASANPRIEIACINVPGLQQFIVEVKGVYTNSWPANDQAIQMQGGPALPQFPPELTTNNYVVLNPWYSIGNTNETRITITAGGKTRRYTQFGDPLDHAPAMAITANHITSSFVRGSWVTMESSVDMIDWTSITNFSDTGGLGFISLTYTKNQPCQFYRVGIQ